MASVATNGTLPMATATGRESKVPAMTVTQPVFQSTHSTITVRDVTGRAASAACPTARPTCATPATSTRYAATHEPCSHPVGPVTAAAKPPATIDTAPAAISGA